MRILYTPKTSAPPVDAQSPSLPAPSPSAPSLEPLMDKMKSLEERVRSLEQAPRTEKPNVPLAKISVDPEAFKKTLLTKMWKYLHDERSPKTI